METATSERTAADAGRPRRTLCVDRGPAALHAHPNAHTRTRWRPVLVFLSALRAGETPAGSCQGWCWRWRTQADRRTGFPLLPSGPDGPLYSCGHPVSRLTRLPHPRTSSGRHLRGEVGRQSSAGRCRGARDVHAALLTRENRNRCYHHGGETGNAGLSRELWAWNGMKKEGGGKKRTSFFARPYTHADFSTIVSPLQPPYLPTYSPTFTDQEQTK